MFYASIYIGLFSTCLPSELCNIHLFLPLWLFVYTRLCPDEDRRHRGCCQSRGEGLLQPRHGDGYMKTTAAFSPLPHFLEYEWVIKTECLHSWKIRSAAEWRNDSKQDGGRDESTSVEILHRSCRLFTSQNIKHLVPLEAEQAVIWGEMGWGCCFCLCCFFILHNSKHQKRACDRCVIVFISTDGTQTIPQACSVFSE